MYTGGPDDSVISGELIVMAKSLIQGGQVPQLNCVISSTQTLSQAVLQQ